MLKEKLDLIIESYLESPIPPKLQVNIPSNVAIDIVLSIKKQYTP